MKVKKMMGTGLAMLLMLTALATSSWAERGWGHGRDDNWRDRYQDRGQEHHQDHDWVLDKRYEHNQYYPRQGYVVQELPGNYRMFRHRDERYYFNDGIWYRPWEGGFAVVLPPIGLVLPFLPPFYTTIWAGDIPYYYANDVYYRWRPEERAYVVSEPPPEKKVVEDAAIPKELFVYPKNGQSQEQQDTDRYECHRWSVEQSNFDPTQPGGNVPEAQNTAKRGEYQRAMKACLEGRGYSVQ